MNVFISGGAKNGKSYFAQQTALNMADELQVPLYYLATMIPHDSEDLARIDRHLKEREGLGFQTIEQGTDICSALSSVTTDGEPVDPKGVFLLDSVTALLSNEMFPGSEPDLNAGERLKKDLLRFAELTGNTVFVSDFIYSDANIYDEFTELYRKSLAEADRTLAKTCRRVIEVSAGLICDYKSY